MNKSLAVGKQQDRESIRKKESDSGSKRGRQKSHLDPWTSQKLFKPLNIIVSAPKSFSDAKQLQTWFVTFWILQFLHLTCSSFTLFMHLNLTSKTSGLSCVTCIHYIDLDNRTFRLNSPEWTDENWRIDWMLLAALRAIDAVTVLTRLLLEQNIVESLPSILWLVFCFEHLVSRNQQPA